MKLLADVKILVVDDDEMLREVVRDMFESEGACVTEAENGAIALTFVKNGSFDVVFSDMRMPGGDGATLARNVAALTTNRPLMFICSGFNDLTADSAAELGIVKVFEKPFHTRKVIAEICAALIPKYEKRAV